MLFLFRCYKVGSNTHLYKQHHFPNQLRLVATGVTYRYLQGKLAPNVTFSQCVIKKIRNNAQASLPISDYIDSTVCNFKYSR